MRASDLSWTIVRAGALSDGPGTGRIRHGFPQSDRTPAMKISRTDVASFMLDEIEKCAYVNATPSVSH